MNRENMEREKGLEPSTSTLARFFRNSSRLRILHTNAPNSKTGGNSKLMATITVLCMLLALPLAGCTTLDPAHQFQVGDIVIARNFTRHPELNGTQVRVTGGFAWRWVKGYDTLRCYSVTTVDGLELAAQSFQLQRAPN